MAKIIPATLDQLNVAERDTTRIDLGGATIIIGEAIMELDMSRWHRLNDAQAELRSQHHALKQMLYELNERQLRARADLAGRDSSIRALRQT